MNESSKAPGKINEHARGAGVPSPLDVEKRAQELALIAGRAASDYNETDLEQARAELLGIQTPATDANTAAAKVTQWDDVPGMAGSKKKSYGPQDEANVASELVENGMDEALHDEMVAAHRKNIDEAS